MALRKETTGTRENMGPSPPGPGVSGGKRKSLPGPCVLCLWHHYGMGYKAAGLLPGRWPWASSGQPILPEQQPQPLSCLPGPRRRWTSPPPTHTHTNTRVNSPTALRPWGENWDPVMENHHGNMPLGMSTKAFLPGPGTYTLNAAAAPTRGLCPQPQG